LTRESLYVSKISPKSGVKTNYIIYSVFVVFFRQVGIFGFKSVATLAQNVWWSFRIYVQLMVTVRVDGATESGDSGSQSEAAATNVWLLPKLNSAADWLPLRRSESRPLAEPTLFCIA